MEVKAIAVTWLNPALICITPNPKEVATPNSVPMVQKALITCPNQPWIRSSNSGYNNERGARDRL
jgi:hypothetical protein